MIQRTGVTIEECAPSENETCEYQRHQQIKGRWRYIACGRPAERGIVVAGTHSYAFCQHCLANAINTLIRILY